MVHGAPEPSKGKVLYYQANPATRRGDGGDHPRFCHLRSYFGLSRALGQL